MQLLYLYIYKNTVMILFLHLYYYSTVIHSLAKGRRGMIGDEMRMQNVTRMRHFSRLPCRSIGYKSTLIACFIRVSSGVIFSNGMCTVRVNASLL